MYDRYQSACIVYSLRSLSRTDWYTIHIVNPTSELYYRLMKNSHSHLFHFWVEYSTWIEPDHFHHFPNILYISNDTYNFMYIFFLCQSRYINIALSICKNISFILLRFCGISEHECENVTKNNSTCVPKAAYCKILTANTIKIRAFISLSRPSIPSFVYSFVRSFIRFFYPALSLCRI